MSSDSELPSVGRVYLELMATAEMTALPQHEDWKDLIERITVPGRINEITEETYWYFLEVLPPRIFNGNEFCFAEGDEPLRLFWHCRGRYFCRQLTWEETYRVCDAGGLRRDYG